MWPETRKKVELEMSLLHRLLGQHCDLLARVECEQPDTVEVLALSALLHSFYTGIENVFKRIALDIDKTIPTGSRTHSELLVQMESATASRPAVISRDLRLRLGEYMDFRHVFRHAYSFDLRWEKMRSLVIGCKETLAQVEIALEKFFDLEQA